MFYRLEPEVAGGLGPLTVRDNSLPAGAILKLNYEFDGWLGDELLESFPCFIITEKLRRRIEEAKSTGCSFDDVEISTSERFRSLYPEIRLRQFHWLKVVGKAGADDFGLSSDGSLVVSERALQAMKQGQLDNCTIEKW